MIQPFLQTKLPEVTRILKENQVTKAYAFGSVCTENFTETSDVDLLIALDEALDPIEYGQRYFAVLKRLQTLLGREVDLVTERSVRSPFFRKKPEQTRQVIYE